MICALGHSLTEAVVHLEQQGVTVRSIEARSKRPIPIGAEARVVRQQLAKDGQVLLTYAWFITEPNISQ